MAIRDIKERTIYQRLVWNLVIFEAKNLLGEGWQFEFQHDSAPSSSGDPYFFGESRQEALTRARVWAWRRNWQWQESADVHMESS